jgi:hypothetical protein
MTGPLVFNTKETDLNSGLAMIRNSEAWPRQVKLWGDDLRHWHKMEISNKYNFPI